jgi:nitroreductase
MEIPYSRWYSAIDQRRARRRFDPRPVDSNLLNRLHSVCIEFRPFPEVRAVLVNQSPDKVLKGVIGAYGKIKGAPAFLAFLGIMESSHVQERVGYLGEGIVLEATALGLGTCWVAGMFRPEVAATLAGTGKNEKVIAVSPVGYAAQHWSMEEKIMTGFGRTHRRKPLSELVNGLEEVKWTPWTKKALETARLAPSAVNRQPWRFLIGRDDVTVSVDNLSDTYHVSKRLDCGIAMLHLEVGALNEGVRGTWEFLSPPGVSRFRVKKY